MILRALAAVALGLFCMTNASHAAEKFKRLSGAEIHARIAGKVVTDEAHWSDRYVLGGTLREMSLGIYKAGTWKVDGNEMCVTRKARNPVTECFEVWQYRDEIEYRRDGVTLNFGVLRNE